jgi:hypothetical protein
VQFVPIPTTYEALNKLFPIWFPFLQGISHRSKEPVWALIDAIARFDVQIGLVWDDEKACALVGIQYRRRGSELIGEVCWLTGTGMKEWRHLLPQLEHFLKDSGCVEIRPICRPGWSRLLREHGYKTTHHVMERTL